MNKKIISILFLLIILVSSLLVYTYIDQPSTETQDDDLPHTTTEEDIFEEIDNTFLDEDDEIEIGEMV